MPIASRIHHSDEGGATHEYDAGPAASSVETNAK